MRGGLDEHYRYVWSLTLILVAFASPPGWCSFCAANVHLHVPGYRKRGSYFSILPSFLSSCLCFARLALALLSQSPSFSLFLPAPRFFSLQPNQHTLCLLISFLPSCLTFLSHALSLSYSCHLIHPPVSPSSLRLASSVQPRDKVDVLSALRHLLLPIVQHRGTLIVGVYSRVEKCLSGCAIPH